jgi:D-alanyl-D-alanine carboxypeptidase
MPTLVPAATPSSQPTAAPAVRTPPATQLSEAPSTIVVASAELAAVATSTKAEPITPELPKSEPAKAGPTKTGVAKAEPAARQAHAHGSWIIQIGAFEGEDEAKQHLSAAQLKIPAMLAAADPFTERLQKGDKALYRARFAGFDKAMAEAACKQLKRSDITCMAVKN